MFSSRRSTIDRLRAVLSKNIIGDELEMGSDLYTIPNLLTTARIVLIVPFLITIVDGRFTAALFLFAIAGLTDVADGYIARKLGQQSAVGRVMDPIADKLLTTTGFVAMAFPHPGFASIPLWLAIGVVLRDLIILAGSAVIYLRRGFTEFKPLLVGKVNTLLEVALIVVFLATNRLGKLTELLPLLYVTVAVSIVVSGVGYLIRGIEIIRVAVEGPTKQSRR